MKKIVLIINLIIVSLGYGQKSDLGRLNIKGGPFFKEFYLTYEGEIPNIPSVYSVVEGNVDYRAALRPNYYYEFNQDGNISSLSPVKGGESVKMFYQGKKEVKRQIGEYDVFEYSYDNKGKLTRKKRINLFTKEVIESSTYQHDAKGNIISEVFLDGYGEQGKNDFTYDTKGNLIKVILEDVVEGGEFVYNYVYDAKGNLSEYKGSADKVLFKYDVKGNMISAKGQYLGELLDLTYKYAFDEKGNWITKYIYSEGKQVAKIQKHIWYDSDDEP